MDVWEIRCLCNCIQFPSQCDEAWTKWLTFFRRYFQMQFHEIKGFVFTVHWSIFLWVHWLWLRATRRPLCIPMCQGTTCCVQIWLHQSRYVSLMLLCISVFSNVEYFVQSDDINQSAWTTGWISLYIWHLKFWIFYLVLNYLCALLHWLWLS